MGGIISGNYEIVNSHTILHPAILLVIYGIPIAWFAVFWKIKQK